MTTENMIQTLANAAKAAGHPKDRIEAGVAACRAQADELEPGNPDTVGNAAMLMADAILGASCPHCGQEWETEAGPWRDLWRSLCDAAAGFRPAAAE